MPHGRRCGCRISPLDRLNNGTVMLNGCLLAGAADGAVPAGQAKVRQRIKDKPEDQVPPCLGQRAVKGHIRVYRAAVVGASMSSR